MAGIPYWTFDIGAYSLGCQGGVFSNGGKDPAYQELYTRMFQLGAFSPIFRSHGSETPREIWEFGEYTASLVKFDNLRYRLLPYIYSLGWRVTHDGYSIMRGLPMDFARDHKTYSIDDQFMFGPAILVSPVTEYMYHRPPEEAVLITPEHFRTKDGKPGLTAKYYCDDGVQEAVSRSRGAERSICIGTRAGRVSSPARKFSMRWEGKLVPTETGKYRFNMKSFGPRASVSGRQGSGSQLRLDGVLHRSRGVWWPGRNMTSRSRHPTPCSALSGHRCTGRLRRSSPAKRGRPSRGRRHRTVYLPAGNQWIDFWTGEMLSGGRNVVADAPIDKIPLMVRSGSIMPMGPFIQYSTEKPADPIELRIYPGADGSFTLYEDENDNYNYEKGVYSTIDFNWDDAQRQLRIEARKGSFPGMLQARTFHVVLVRKGHGTGVEVTDAPDKVISYQGGQQTVRLPL